MARRLQRRARSAHSVAAEIRETRLHIQLIAGIGFLFLTAGIFAEQVLLR